MPEEPVADLTPRQRQILELLDRGAPIKLIAAELQISQARVSQIIRALKDSFGTESRYGLVRAFRGENGPGEAYKNNQYQKNILPVDDLPRNDLRGTAEGEFLFSDSASFNFEAPWVAVNEPKIVPEVLDRAHSVGWRLSVMLGMTAAIAAIIVLVITASVAVASIWGNKSVETLPSFENAGDAPAKEGLT